MLFEVTNAKITMQMALNQADWPDQIVDAFRSEMNGSNENGKESMKKLLDTEGG
jgi:hypothetical protein